MRWLWMATMLLMISAVSAPPSSAQAPREDVMWARTTSETITLDGVLNEPGWAAAESVTIDWAVDAGLPTRVHRRAIHRARPARGQNHLLGQEHLHVTAASPLQAHHK